MDEKELSTLSHKGILQLARQRRKLTQVVLAGRLGVKQNALAQSLSRPRISLDMFTRILNAMDYDVVVVDKTTGEPVWKLDVRTIDELLESMAEDE